MGMGSSFLFFKRVELDSSRWRGGVREGGEGKILSHYLLISHTVISDCFFYQYQYQYQVLYLFYCTPGLVPVCTGTLCN